MRLLSFLLSFVMAASLFTGVGSTTAYADTTNNTIELSEGGVEYYIKNNNTYTIWDPETYDSLGDVNYNPSEPLVVTQSDPTKAIDCRIISEDSSVDVKIELSGVNVSTDDSFIKAAGNVDLTVNGENTVEVRGRYNTE